MASAIRLSSASLVQLPEAVARPTYERSALRRGIVHLGMGGFHRAHMARYTHDLMERRADALEWGICGVGLMPGDIRLGEALGPQDNLYTLVERDTAGEQATVIGSVAQTIFAPAQAAALRAALDDRATRIVSLTVTEAGYCLDSGTKRLNPDHPLIAHDLAQRDAPQSAIGIIVAALRRRRDAGSAAFTVLSCDNIQHNGDVLARAVLDFAAATDADLARWIEDCASFPNTMVDRITPVTQPEEIERFARRYGYADAWPIFAESFRQWVIEDRFVAGRPLWDEVGAQFAVDVTPYEKMKLRLLNASHLAISAPGELAGYALIDEAMNDHRLCAYMAALMEHETGPTIEPPAGIDLAVYKAELIRRFANPDIRDTTARVNRDAPLNYLLDPLRDRVRAGQESPLLLYALAAWIRRLRGLDDQGQAIAVRHPMADALRRLTVTEILAVEPLFGDLAGHPMLVRGVSDWLAAMDRYGTLGALGRYQDTGAIG